MEFSSIFPGLQAFRVPKVRRVRHQTQVSVSECAGDNFNDRSADKLNHETMQRFLCNNDKIAARFVAFLRLRQPSRVQIDVPAISFKLIPQEIKHYRPNSSLNPWKYFSIL